VGVDIDFITVALATYQRQQELQRALEALVRQRFERLRVLISDDAPNAESRRYVDGIEDLSATYLERHSRLGVLRNHLSMISETNSDLFMFHGDDDELLSDALYHLSEPLKASRDYDGVFGNYLVGPTRQVSHAVSFNRLPFVRYWRHHDWRVRMLAYYLCPAFLGKQNMFYGLFRTEAVHKIDVEKAIPPRQHHLNMDEMFVFQAVCNGPIHVVSQECYFFAEGNAKHYVDAPQARQSSLGAFIGFAQYEWITLFDYLRNAPGRWVQVVLLGLFPLKFVTALAWRYLMWLK